MEGGPKSLNAGLKFDDEGKDGEGTEEPGQTEHTLITNTDVINICSRIPFVGRFFYFVAGVRVALV